MLSGHSQTVSRASQSDGLNHQKSPQFKGSWSHLYKKKSPQWESNIVFRTKKIVFPEISKEVQPASGGFKVLFSLLLSLLNQFSPQHKRLVCVSHAMCSETNCWLQFRPFFQNICKPRSWFISNIRILDSKGESHLKQSHLKCTH